MPLSHTSRPGDILTTVCVHGFPSGTFYLQPKDMQIGEVIFNVSTACTLDSQRTDGTFTTYLHLEHQLNSNNLLLIITFMQLKVKVLYMEKEAHSEDLHGQGLLVVMLSSCYFRSQGPRTSSFLLAAHS